MKVRELIEALGQHPEDYDVQVLLEPNAKEYGGCPTGSESLTYVSDETHYEIVTIWGVALPVPDEPIHLNN